MNLAWSVIVDEYREVCLKAATDNDAFSVFRRDPVFTKVMEFHYQEYGQRCLDIIKRDNPSLLRWMKVFKTGDKRGNPLVYDYDGVSISPSTLRYVKCLSDMIKYFGSLDGFKTAEIGSAYGGQCKVITDIYDVDYHCIDLEEVNMLAKRFIGVSDVRYSTWDMLVKEDYDLIISVGAFTEMNRELQDHYNDMIIKGSKRGYMIGSVILNPNNCYQIADLNKMGDVVFTGEEPETHPTNFTMYWR